jgi:predicted ABC-type ATPase
MGRPAFWIVGGPNGAGKTTLASHSRFQRLLGEARFLNPDEMALQRLQAAGRKGFHEATAEQLTRFFIEAAEAVEHDVRESLRRGEAIGVESVLSTRKYCPIVQEAITKGIFFGLIYVALNTPELSRQRVAHRVKQGGHDVPPEKLADRWARSIENLGWFAQRATRLWVFDNSDSTPEMPPRLIAKGGGELIDILDPEAIPQITRVLK